MNELSHLQQGPSFMNIPSKILKRYADVICKPLTDVVNDNFEKYYFPNNSKEDDITAIYKKDEQTNTKNQRPITIFNICINDLFFLVTDTEMCNYADDTTIFSCGYEIDNILETLQRDANLLSDWFVDNYMEMNDDKSHLLMFGNKENSSITIG